MSETGKVAAVREDPIGTSLDGAHAAGVSILTVLDPGEFTENGGTLQLDLGAAAETLTYTAWDEEASTITLSTPTATAHDDGCAVLVLPLTSQMLASVVLDETGEAVTVDVPHVMRAWLPKTTSGGQTVVLSQTEDGLILTDMVKETALMDGSTIDPDSTIPPKAMTDGKVPDASPACSVAGFLGTLLVKWLPIMNPDLVSYEVHVSTTSGFTPDASTWVGATNGTTMYVRQLGDGSPLQYGIDYFVRIVATDADGPAPAGVEAGAAPTQVQLEDIAFGAITAEHLEAVLALVTVLQAGPLIEVSAAGGTAASPTGGIIVKDPANPTGTPLVRLHPLGCRFRGELVTDILTVLTEAVVNTTLTLASGSTTVLKAGVSNPPAPALSASRMEQTWPAVPAGFAQRGIHWDSTDGVWLRLLVPSAGLVAARSKVQRISTAGAVVSTVTLAGVTGITEIDFNSIVRVGAFYYSMARSSVNDESDSLWYPTRWDTTGAFDGRWAGYFRGGGGGPARPAIGTNAGRSTLYIAEPAANTSSPQIFVHSASPSATTNPWTPQTSFNLPAGVSVGLMACGYENYDYGSPRFVIAAGSGAQVLSGAINALTFQASESFSIDTSAFNGGLAWDGSNFYSTHGGEVLYRYSSYYPSAGEKWWAKYADTGAGNTTAASPLSAGLAVPARRYVTATLRPAPFGVSGADLWVGYGTTAPATLYKRAEAISARVFVLTAGKSTTGATTVPSTNTIGGTAALLASETGGAELKGDGQFKAPLFQQSGAVTITPSAANTPTSVNVVFDVQFKNIPRVVCTANSGVPGTQVTGVGRTNVTTTGFTAWLTRTNTNATSVDWIATVA